ncbi:hypothetical protein VPHK460_0282 [Vibrio phage K460]
MIDKLKRNWYLLCAKWKYRKQEYEEVCCCGSDMAPDHWDGYRDYSTYSCSSYYCPSRCAKEYAITCYVEGKMK